MVYDGTWEMMAANMLEKDPNVAAWAKNDHLGFVVRYLYRGSSRNFFPDYLIRFTNGHHLILEIKGQDSQQNQAKREAMKIWIQAVNDQGGFGHWDFDVVFDPAKIRDVVGKYGVSN